MNSLKKLLKIIAYALLVILGVVFCVSNRGKIDLNLFPIPYLVSVPVFLFAVVVFALGCLLGWGIAHVGTFRKHLEHRDAHRRIAALENELAAHRSEQLLRRPSLLK